MNEIDIKILLCTNVIPHFHNQTGQADPSSWPRRSFQWETTFVLLLELFLALVSISGWGWAISVIIFECEPFWLYYLWVWAIWVIILEVEPFQLLSLRVSHFSYYPWVWAIWVIILEVEPYQLLSMSLSHFSYYPWRWAIWVIILEVSFNFFSHFILSSVQYLSAYICLPSIVEYRFL